MDRLLKVHYVAIYTFTASLITIWTVINIIIDIEDRVDMHKTCLSIISFLPPLLKKHWEFLNLQRLLVRMTWALRQKFSSPFIKQINEYLFSDIIKQMMFHF